MASNCKSAQIAIDNAWRKLSATWLTVCEQWRDGAQQRFDHEFWSEFAHIIPEFQSDLQSLTSVIEQARRNVR